METGAIILTSPANERPDTGLGSLSALQRLVITFSQADIRRIAALVPKKALSETEKELSRMGALYFCPETDSFEDWLKCFQETFSFLARKCGRFLLVSDSFPLFTVETVEKLLFTSAPFVRPTCRGKDGYPVLLSKEELAAMLAEAVTISSTQEIGQGVEDLLRLGGRVPEKIETQDSGVTFDIQSGEDCGELLERHRRQCLRPTLKLRLAKEQIFFGPGVQQLLTLIDDTNSVRVACSQMGISYSKGWKMIQLMEEQMGVQTVTRQQGGKNGGSAFLTPEGKELLKRYNLFERQCQQAVRRIFREVFFEEPG